MRSAVALVAVVNVLGLVMAAVVVVVVAAEAAFVVAVAVAVVVDRPSIAEIAGYEFATNGLACASINDEAAYPIGPSS